MKQGLLLNKLLGLVKTLFQKCEILNLVCGHAGSMVLFFINQYPGVSLRAGYWANCPNVYTILPGCF